MTITVLNEVTANLGVLYFKLHQKHFYVKGPQFYALHEKFEELYDQVHEFLDETAERVLVLNGKPVSTLGEFLALSTIKEAPYTVEQTAVDMVQEIVADFKTVIAIAAKAIALDGIDEVSQDFFIGLKGEFEKHVWMLEATCA